MSITIGAAREHGFDEPLGLLSDCHRRVEKFLSVLEAIGGTPPPGRLDHGERAALCHALDYFRNAAPKHTADEEESLFPRLRAAAGSDALEQIDRVERDHHVAAPRHEVVERIGRKWLEDAALPAAEQHEFSAAVQSLTVMYREHIALEESEIFPLAQRVLTPLEKAQFGREMAARRGVELPETAGTGLSGECDGS